MQSVEQDSPFHFAELEVQRRAGTDERLQDIGRRVIRDHLLQQHQDFFSAQHQLLLAMVDEQGRPWVAMAAGAPGFVSAVSRTRLRIDALPLAGPPTLANGGSLVVGAQVGVLGLDYSSRRRNRVNGRIVSVDQCGFELQVVHSFGNCPKYIQLRETRIPDDRHWRAQPVDGAVLSSFDDEAVQVIAQADHFYIASHYDRPGDEVHHGADASHRGGKPGFVRIDDDGALVFPDFPGNRFFNTLGNITANGKAALLFTDFESGSLLSMTGQASIDWRAADEHGFAGAERLVRFSPSEAWLYRNALPFEWRFTAFSPVLASTGDWDSAASATEDPAGPADRSG